jgi:HK97 family phage prohead protease
MNLLDQVIALLRGGNARGQVLHAPKLDEQAVELLRADLERIQAGSPKRAMFGVERRFIPEQVELRKAKFGGPGRMVGYAAKFGVLSVDLGGWKELLQPGAFAMAIANGEDCRCLRNHMDDNLLGRQSAGTLELQEDADGLRFECDLPDTQTGRDTAENIRRKDMTGCSFQFSVREGGTQWNFDAEMPLRTVLANGVKRLYDVGPVTFPAYESTEVDMRSFEAARAALQHLPAAAVLEAISRAKARQRLAEAL